MNKNKGFTLIELLVVIAIIGILSAVVLASLSNARDKAKDASVQSQLSSMKAQAELYYSKNESYDGVCSALQTDNGFGGQNGPGLLKAAYDSSPTADLDKKAVIDSTANQLWNEGVCNDKADNGTVYGGWAVSIPLSDAVSGSPSFYCVDNTSLSKKIITPLDAGAFSCPAN